MTLDNVNASLLATTNKKTPSSSRSPGSLRKLAVGADKPKDLLGFIDYCNAEAEPDPATLVPDTPVLNKTSTSGSTKKVMLQDSQQREDVYQETMDSSGMGPYNAISWPYNFNALKKMPSTNSTLRQCIDAMVFNVHGHGYRLEYVGPTGKETSPAAQLEKEKLESFIENPNGEYSLTVLRQRLADDFYTTGNAYLEVTRFKGTNNISGLFHTPAYTMYLTQHDSDPVVVKETVKIGGGRYRERTYKKRFRRYMQLINGQKVYFKEFGDPRIIDPQTGLVNDKLSHEQSATEIYHISEYMAGSAYGLPRWFSQMPSVMGSRQAELTNLSFFSDNAIPAMAVLVSGGYITEESMDTLKYTFESMQGRRAQNGIAIIEASGDPDAASEDGRMPTPRIELKPLAGERQTEGQFIEYDKECRKKIRSAFRLPPIFIGLSEDYNRASSDTSLIMAESQVFAPERRLFDDFFNDKILKQFKLKYFKFKSQPPRIAGAFELTEMLKGLEASGAVSPNKAIELMNEFLDMEVRPYEEVWANYPMKLLHAAAQNGMFPETMIPFIRFNVGKPSNNSSGASDGADAADTASGIDTTTQTDNFSDNGGV